MMVDVGIILDHYRPLIAIKTIKPIKSILTIKTIKTHHLQVPFSLLNFYKKRIGAQPFGQRRRDRETQLKATFTHQESESSGSCGVLQRCGIVFLGKMGMLQNVYIPKWNG